MKFITACTVMLLALFMLIACQQTNKPPRDTDSHKNVTPATLSPAYQAASKSEVIGTWYVEYIGERPVIDHSPARIQFTHEGAINGNASCNRFFGSYTYKNGQLTIPGNLGATKMACLPALMEQEQRLFEHLPTATHAVVENGLLILRNAQGTQVIRASRDESQQ